MLAKIFAIKIASLPFSFIGTKIAICLTLQSNLCFLSGKVLPNSTDGDFSIPLVRLENCQRCQLNIELFCPHR